MSLIMAITVLAPEGALTLPLSLALLGEQSVSADAPPAPAVEEAQIAAAAARASASGMVTVTVTVQGSQVRIPIYRFYSPKSGTHFYTPSAEERDMVIRRWPDVWSYEGIAYQVNPRTNSQPIYRFYNGKNGSHFYTASTAERDMVLQRWSNVFHYDGPTYSVSPQAAPGKASVFRFYNVKNGSHFYTASTEERDMVLSRWGAIYKLEGVAFYIGM